MIDGQDDPNPATVRCVDGAVMSTAARGDTFHASIEGDAMATRASNWSPAIDHEQIVASAIRVSASRDDVDVERALHLLQEHRSMDSAMAAVLQGALRDGSRLRDVVASLNDLTRRLVKGHEACDAASSTKGVATMHDLHELAETLTLARDMSMRLRHGLMAAVAATEAQDAVVAEAIHALSPSPLVAVHVVRTGTATAALLSEALSGVYPIASGTLIKASDGWYIARTEKGVLTISAASLDNDSSTVDPWASGVGLGVVGRDDLLFVDALVREDEVVVGPAPPYLRGLCGIVGCIDGGAAPVVPVVDPTALLRLWDMPPRW